MARPEEKMKQESEIVMSSYTNFIHCLAPIKKKILLLIHKQQKMLWCTSGGIIMKQGDNSSLNHHELCKVHFELKQQPNLARKSSTYYVPSSMTKKCN